jgi:enoyl-CoA hydratase/carnithine racemase
VAHVWSEVPVPVIAAVSGPCLGGGFQIALGADIRIVHPEAKMSVLEIRWGLTPDMTVTATLPRLVGLDVAKELTWTGRMLSGAEAHALGIATRVSDDPFGDALALAQEIAAKSPQAIRGAKKLLEQSGRVPLAQQYADERTTIGSLIGQPNQVEAVTAYFEKRAAVFHD